MCRHTITLALLGFVASLMLVPVTGCGGGDGQEQPEAGFGSIAVDSTPSGAAIWLDGSNTGKVTPATLLYVPAGLHQVVLILTGYQDWGQSVMVTADQTVTLWATLLPLPTDTGSITVSSTPGGATIWLDGTNTGRITPATLSGIAPGSHALKLTLSGYQDWERSVSVSVGQTSNVSATLIPVGAATGSIAVSSTPSGAAIWLDEQNTGQVTPATLSSVYAGTHAIRLTLSGYLDWEDAAVVVMGGQTTNVTATLSRAIVIDGDFSDWASIASMPDPSGDPDDRDDRYNPILNIDQPDVDILEWQFTDQNGYLLVYARVAGQIGRTVPGDWGDRYYFMVHLDVDNNLKTGFETYIPFPTPEEEDYTDWYYPSNLGSDYSFEFEFRSGELQRTFITYWGPGNDTLGRWPYKGMLEFRTNVPEMAYMGGQVEMRAPFSAFGPHVHRGTIMDVAISTESSSRVWGVGWCQDSTDMINNYVVQSTD